MHIHSIIYRIVDRSRISYFGFFSFRKIWIKCDWSVFGSSERRQSRGASEYIGRDELLRSLLGSWSVSLKRKVPDSHLNEVSYLLGIISLEKEKEREQG